MRSSVLLLATVMGLASLTSVIAVSPWIGSYYYFFDPPSMSVDPPVIGVGDAAVISANVTFDHYANFTFLPFEVQLQDTFFDPEQNKTVTITQKDGFVFSTENEFFDHIQATFIEPFYVAGPHQLNMSITVPGFGTSSALSKTIDVSSNKIIIKLLSTDDRYSRLLGVAANSHLPDVWWINSVNFLCDFFVQPSDVGKEFSCSIPHVYDFEFAEASISSDAGYTWEIMVTYPDGRSATCTIGRTTRCSPV